MCLLVLHCHSFKNCASSFYRFEVHFFDWWMCAFVMLGLVFPYQPKRLAWGTSREWPVCVKWDLKPQLSQSMWCWILWLCYTERCLDNAWLMNRYELSAVLGAQGELHLIESEITQLRESNVLQKKRLMETVSSVLKDLAEVGTVFGGELKVIVFVLFCLNFYWQAVRR